MNRELYQELILEHFRSPRFKQALAISDPGVFTLQNPHCGDQVILRAIELDEGRLRWEHNASGCAASVASTSMLCEQLQGLEVGEARVQIEAFLNALRSPVNANSPLDASSMLPEAMQGNLELEALLLFRSNAARQFCVSLAWTCAENALAAL
ncbi:MAG: iron-sulfur cluster assembly scaffold protein [Puniceicoccaceae bacterium]